MLYFLGEILKHTYGFLFSRYGVTLFAVQAAKKGWRILLNPGCSHVMDYNDQCFYISISSEEDSHITAYKEPKEPLRLFRGSFRGNKDSFITASSIALELRGENAGSSKRKIDTGVLKNPNNLNFS